MKYTPEKQKIAFSGINQFCQRLALLIIMLVVTGYCGQGNAQDVGVAISADNSAPNTNAMLDVKSPATGAGKGMLVPRVTQTQRTTASAALAGGLLDDSGQLRGGAAQGLLVYQTDGNQGFYYNQSTGTTPSWVYIDFQGPLPLQRGGLGADVSGYNGLVKISGGKASNVGLSSAGQGNLSVPYNMPKTNGSNNQYLTTNGSGTASWGTVTVPIPGYVITIGNSTYATSNGIAIGVQANAKSTGTAIGYSANSSYYGAALGYKANGNDCNVALGYAANAYTGRGPYAGSVAIGYRANSYSGDGKYTGGVAIGYKANARHNFNENDSGAVAIGFKANSFIRGAGVGYKAAGYNQGVAVGYHSTGSNQGVGIGYRANGYMNGTAVGYRANSGNQRYSFAKGAYSTCVRQNEEWKSSDGIQNGFGYGQVNFHGKTSYGMPSEIYLGGTDGKRFEVGKHSAVSYQMLVSAYDTENDETSVWRCWGGVKRIEGTNTTALIAPAVITAQTQGSLNKPPTISVDIVRGALKLQVTGVDGHYVLWNAQMIYSEIRKNGWQR